MSSDSRHVFHLKDHKAFHKSKLGSIQRCTVDELPILKGMSLKRQVLGPKAIREPHWYANTNELTYCISGRSLVSVLDHGSSHHTFTIEKG
jgi:oxalate decarboxylase